MKILIVDDEKLLCKQLVNIINNESWHWKQIFTCNNAFDAISIVDKENPEIVFTDIRMPQKDGLELTRYIYEKSPQTIIILITGFSDFEYAQTGIKYHVFDYILKPIECERIISTLRKALLQLNEQRSYENLHFIMKNYFVENSTILLHSFLEVILFHPETLSSSLLNQQAQFFSLSFDNYFLVGIRSVFTNTLNPMEDYYTIHLVKDSIKKNNLSPITYLWGNTLYWIISSDKKETLSVNYIESCLSTLQNEIETTYPFILHFAISEHGDEISKLCSLRQQTELCFEFKKNWNDKTSFIFFEDLSIESNNVWNNQNDIKQLCLQIRCGNKDMLSSILTDLIHSLNSHSPKQKDNISNLICAQLAVTFSEINYNFSDFHFLKDMIQKCVYHNDTSSYEFMQIIYILDKACQTVTNHIDQANDHIVNSVLEYINKNYKEQISLTDAADSVYRNSSYISRLIKQSTGKSFTQILTDKRLDEAKKLLRNSTMPISAISLAVGYPNVKYFSRLFNNRIGMVPNDYRKLIQTLF